MRITQDRLRQIIKEELQAVLSEEELAGEGMTLSELGWQPYQHTNSIGDTEEIMMIIDPAGGGKHLRNKAEFEQMKEKYGELKIEKATDPNDPDIIVRSGPATENKPYTAWKMTTVPDEYTKEKEYVERGMKKYFD